MNVTFSSLAFPSSRSELDHFRSNGGEPPQCGITLCFGEELSNSEDPSRKLIIVQVSEAFFDLDQSSCSLFEGLMLTPTLNFDAPADHFTVGGAAGPEHSVHLRLHPHPPVSGQSVSTRGNNSKPGHRALADVRDDHLRVHLSTLSNVKEEGFDYKIRDIPTLLQNKSTQG